ncbi:hypothetical protein ACVIGB_009438 [Bradyrhizobium sp. USDA 4341]|uniref:Uncharacterized protein n=1 Tax=Bradyrhizobium erythrophlei TaxID=1437360 RepID=A0A1H5IJ76_9BRAD|nr:hypothetical protein SAMN05444164_7936 [Bradyrhizobium erythrophlei]
MTHRPRNTLAVVPAQAGTHNHNWLLLRDVGMTSPVHNVRRSVWVPAFAGTTVVNVAAAETQNAVYPPSITKQSAV